MAPAPWQGARDANGGQWVRVSNMRGPRGPPRVPLVDYYTGHSEQGRRVPKIKNSQKEQNQVRAA
eukprot:7639806-Alexandrium_andersonii.AAC.1